MPVCVYRVHFRTDRGRCTPQPLYSFATREGSTQIYLNLFHGDCSPMDGAMFFKGGVGSVRREQSPEEAMVQV